MKKIIVSLALALVLILGVGLTACSKDPSSVSYTVTFMNGTTVFDTQTVNENETAAKPATDPAKTGYTFSGWFETLNADGTGSGTAFNFTTKITKDLTLKAAFLENLNQPLTAFIKSYYGSFFPMAVSNSGTLAPSGYDMEAYTHSDFSVLLFSETTEYTLSDDLKYLDISTLAASEDISEFFNYTQYSFNTGNLYYNQKSYNGYTYLTVNDSGSGESVEHRKFGEITYSEISLASEKYYIISNSNTVKVYVLTETIELGDSLTINNEFINNYCANGVVIIESGSRSLRPEYIELMIDGNTNCIKENESFDLSIYNKPDHTLISYYYKLIEAQIQLTHTDVLSETSIEKYRNLLTEDYSDKWFDENLNPLPDEPSDYYLYLSGNQASFSAEIHIDSDNNGAIDLIYFISIGYFDSMRVSIFIGPDFADYSIGYDATAQRYRAYYREETIFSGNTIPADQFFACKILNESFNLYNNHYIPIVLGEVFNVTSDSWLMFTAPEDGDYTFSGFDYTYQQNISIYSEVWSSDRFAFFTNDQPTTLSLTAGKTYFIRIEKGSVDYKFEISKA